MVGRDRSGVRRVEVGWRTEVGSSKVVTSVLAACRFLQSSFLFFCCCWRVDATVRSDPIESPRGLGWVTLPEESVLEFHGCRANLVERTGMHEPECSARRITVAGSTPTTILRSKSRVVEGAPAVGLNAESLGRVNNLKVNTERKVPYLRYLGNYLTKVLYLRYLT